MACAAYTVSTVCVKLISCNVAAFDGLLHFKVKFTLSHPYCAGRWPDQACTERLRIDRVNFATSSSTLQIDVMGHVMTHGCAMH